jgi:O-acetyl-ADP-ribose deacetylase (regulator of RNase III)
MGAGIALQIKNNWPEAYRADLDSDYGSKDKLGDYTLVTVANDSTGLTIVNAYTQFDFGKGKINLDYGAVNEVMVKLNERFDGKRFGMPKIGCGLAGGDWNEVAGIIEDTIGKQDITIVEYKG